MTLRTLLHAALLAGAAALLGGAARADDARALVLEHLTTADGLPQSTVYATLQDSQGFIWLATEDGLVRYDGHEMHRYAYNHSAPRSLPGNFIRELIEDKAGNLWIAVKDSGLARYNRDSDDFTVFRHDPSDPNSLASDTLRALAIDGRGRIWVGTIDAGVDVLDPASGHIEHFRHDTADPASLSGDDVFSLLLARDNTVWVGTGSGLDHWHPARQGFEHFRHDPARLDTLSSNRVSALAEDRSGALWVGTLDAGLNRMDARGAVLQRFRHATATTSLASDDVKAILEDHAGNLWVGTADGLDLIDAPHDSVVHYAHEESDAASLRDSFIMSLYEDRSGLVWIGTRDGGVSRWNPRSWELGGHRPAWLLGKPVTAFAESKDHGLWIASMGGGLKRFDPVSGKAQDLDAILGRRNVLGDARVMALLADRRGGLWIGTMWNGLKHLTAEGRIETFPERAGDARAVSAKGIMTLYESGRGDIWVGTYGGGVNRVDPDSGTVRQLPFDAASAGAVSSANVTSITEDGRGNLWFGTDGGGLDLAAADGRVIAVFKNDPNDVASLPSNTIYAITVDDAGTLWAGTDKGGLARAVRSDVDPATLHFETVSRDQGLSSDTIYAVLDDHAGHLWLSGNAGLMRYSPLSHAIKTYHREHGTQGEEFDLNAYLRLADGRLAFGGPGGFNLFDPKRLTENTRAPRLALTRLEVLGAPLPTAKPYWLLDNIDLDYHASIVSLDFSALDFTSPKRNRLAYRIPGLADRWIDLDSQHRVTLTNLDAGVHQLEVRAANADSLWSEPLRFTLHRAPLPWRSAWAYALYALLLALLIAHQIYRSREKLRGMRHAKQQLESEVALRTQELRESNRQLADASQAKSNFLARMSHELRTPMNGVLGSTELLARTPQSVKQSRLTETIRASAQVLLQIVNDLLDLSKIQAGKFELESLPLDLVAIFEESATLFAANAEGKGVELVVDPPPQIEHVLEGDGLRLRQIIMNLIGNAVKFTSQGAITVKADVLINEGAASLHFEVTDTGIGMDEATIVKIFEPFTQADESTTRRFGGTGLGLAICRELTQRMGGTVEVTSRPKLGSSFHVRIPMKLGAALGREGFNCGRQVAVLSHRTALSEALKRHVQAIGGEVRSGEAHGEDIVVADAVSCAPAIRELLSSRGPGALIVVASDPEADALQTELDLSQAIFLQKPVHRERLREALAGAASGKPIGFVRAVPASPQFAGHVLLVEDEPVNAGIAQGYLTALGLSSAWDSSGAEAVARCAAERFDLIMMDLNMPEMDGFTAARAIRMGSTANRSTPIIALTAHQAPGYREASLQAGMNDLLSKPYTFAECARLLSRFLELRGAATPKDVDALPQAKGLGAERLGAGALTEIDAATVASLRALKGSGSSNLHATLAGLFLKSSTDSIAQLQIAAAGGERGQIAAICHKLAAAAANVGALAFARHARELEAVSSAGESARIGVLSQALIAAHPALCAELLRYTLKASA